MEWDPKGVCVPPPDVKRNRMNTLKAKYEEMFDDEMGAVFAFLPILLWEKNVFESNMQSAKKLREKTNTCITGKKWKPITLDELLHFIGILMHVVNVQYANRGYRYYWKVQPHPFFSSTTYRLADLSKFDNAFISTQILTKKLQEIRFTGCVQY
jgi:hypothetical protein